MEIIIAPDARLRVKTKIVNKLTPSLKAIIKEMVKLSKTFIDPEGVGLASTQIGNSEQYFVMKLSDGTFKAVFNPKILSYGKKTKVFFEGCLSIPKYYGEVKRPTNIRVIYMDKDGTQVKESLKGVSAWIFQHEYDHLQGKLFMDLLLAQKGKLFKVVGKDRAGADIFQEVGL
ncbi:peptide deformylase [Candidatus Daviesbacteria bacterium]|nr:peptide deformylase [Candidatus Daviesbacteria bacterium]